MKRKCSECADEGIFPVEDGKWFCHAHMAERIHSPWNMTLNEAGMDLRDFLEDGGKVS